MEIPMELAISVAVPGVLAVGWLFRLEMRAMYTARGLEEHKEEMRSVISEMKTKHETLDEKIMEKLSTMEKSLAKIEGKLSIQVND